METIAHFGKLIKEMHSELREQTTAIKELAVAFAKGNRELAQHDQLTYLGIVKSRVMREVEDIKRMESAAQIGSAEGALLGGVAAFTLGSLFAAGRGRKDAPQFGVRLAKSILTRQVPFGTVLIAVGKGGLPKSLKVIPLSRLARELNKSESEVEASLKHDGYRLMTPETFAKVLDKVERGILDGSVSLPIVIDEIIEQIN